MTASANSRIYLLILSIHFCVLGSCKNEIQEVRIANYLLEKKAYTLQNQKSINKVFDYFLKESAWKDKIHFNQQYNPDFLNVYLLKGQSSLIQNDPTLEQLSSNCYYAGHNIFFIDVDYFDLFLKEHRVFQGPYENNRERLMLWVVGHELGHLICNHMYGHFSPGALDKFVETSSIENKEELQADSFFVSAIVADKKCLYSEQNLMISILNAEIERKIGKQSLIYGVGIIYDYTQKNIVDYARQSTHPEYVIRLSRMMELSAIQGRDSAFYNLVSGFTKQLKEVKSR